MAAAARANAQRLAELAVSETGYGNAKDKLAKNMLCADLLPRRMRGIKTIGVIRELPDEKVTEIGVPVERDERPSCPLPIQRRRRSTRA